MPETREREKPHSISDYYSAVQLRSDRWSGLRQVTDSLARGGPEGRSADKLTKKAESFFDVLLPIEMYWAFPGRAGGPQGR